MPTSCDISISLRIIENMSTLELVGTNYNAPSQALLLRSFSKGGLRGPLKAVGPLEFICEHSYPSRPCKLFLPYAEFLFSSWHQVTLDLA